MGNPSPLTELPTEPCLDDDVRKRAMELAALDNPLAVISSVLKDSHARRLERATNTNSDSSYRSDDSEVLFLPTRFPHIPYRYFDVPFGSTKVIAFDIFGTILVSTLDLLCVVHRTDAHSYEGLRECHQHCVEPLVRSIACQGFNNAGTCH